MADNFPQQRTLFPRPGGGLSVVGLFAGVAGIERGLESAGHHSTMLCEIDPSAQAVLRQHYPGTELIADVRDIGRLPAVDLVTAGFPCQDLSQAGRTAGIRGDSGSGWRGIPTRSNLTMRPNGCCSKTCPSCFGSTGQGDASSHRHARPHGVHVGVSDRRHSVVRASAMLQACGHAGLQSARPPRGASPRIRRTLRPAHNGHTAYGFYWTEGLRGLGWGVSCVPTLKGGSGLGIPSPPAIWMPDGSIVTPDIRDAERLQGFPVEWTAPVDGLPGARKGARWKLVGNAVSVPLSRWVGQRIGDPRPYQHAGDEVLQDGESWPVAAWGADGEAFRVDLGEWPCLSSDGSAC